MLIINFSILTSVAVSFTAFNSVAFKKWWAFIICSIFFSTQEQEHTNSLVHLEGVKLGLLIFPHSSGGKESTCNAGDPGLIPGSGRSPREGVLSGPRVTARLSPPSYWLPTNPASTQLPNKNASTGFPCAAAFPLQDSGFSDLLFLRLWFCDSVKSPDCASQRRRQYKEPSSLL